MIEKKRKILWALLLSAALLLESLGGAVMAYASGEDGGSQNEVVLMDDFSSYPDDQALRAAYRISGDENEVALIPSPFAEGEAAMKLIYVQAADGYSGVYHALNQDWSGVEFLEFWFQGDGSGYDILFQITSGAGGYEVHFNELEGFDPTSAEPQLLQIPIEAFQLKDGDPAGLNLKKLSAMSIFISNAYGADHNEYVFGNIILNMRESAENPDPGPTPPPSSHSFYVDDFNAYATSEELQAAYSVNGGGDYAAVELAESPFAEAEGYVMKFRYDLLSQGYSGVSYPVTQSWKRADRISFLYQGDGKGHDVLLQLINGGSSFEAHLGDQEGFERDSAEPQFIEIPIADFRPKNGGDEAIDREGIETFAIYVNRGDNDNYDESALYFGNFLVKEEVPMITVEDYSAYSGSEALMAAYPANANGSANSVELITSPFADEGTAMQFNYSLGTEGYTGVIRRFQQNWTNAETVRLWYQGDGLGQDVILQICDGDPSQVNHTFEVHLNDLEGFDQASTEPQYLEIPISAFGCKGSGDIDLSGIQSFAIYVNAAGGFTTTGSSLIIGSITLALSDFQSDDDDVPELPEDAVIIDDFESYDSSALVSDIYVRDESGADNSTSVAESPFQGAGQAMAFHYTTAGAVFSGINRTLDASDWSGARSLKVWFKGNGLSGQAIMLRLVSGQEVFELNLLNHQGFDTNSVKPQYLDISLDEFTPAEEGAATELDLTRIDGLGIYVKRTGGEVKSGTLYFDNIAWSATEAAQAKSSYQVELSGAEWTAGAEDTLLSLLQENSAITRLEGPADEEAPYLYQVMYRSSDNGILADNERFSSKGIFRKPGHVTVYIEKVAVYGGGKRHLTELNRYVDIEVTATAEPVDVLDYLKGLKGNGTLSAMHNKEPNENPRSSWDRIIADTGVTPAIWSGDFLYLKDDVKYRQRMISEAIRQWQDGALINIMFHVPTPLRTVEQEQAGATWSPSAGGNSVQYDLSDEEWNSLLTEGGDLNENWKQRLDVYAAYLQQLKDAGVVPMVRPFHEMNQYMFWWNCERNPENTKNLYRMTKDYLVEEKGLDNMIWLWNVQDFGNRMQWEKFDPDTDEKQYWDILTLDVYEGGYSEAFYRNMQNYSKGRPIAIGECWSLIQPEQLAQRPDYVFAMPWADDTWVMNSAAQIKAFYRSTIPITDMPVFASRSESVEPEPENRSFDVVTEVFDWGQNVRSVIIDMETEVAAGAVGKDSFAVLAKHSRGELTAFNGSRTIEQVYVSESDTDLQPAERGRYVVIEMKTGKDLAEASTTAWNGTIRQTTGLDLSYRVMQRKAIGTIAPGSCKYQQEQIREPELERFEQGSYEDTNGEHPYRLYRPEAKAGQKYPLVVWMHGNGERGNDGNIHISASRGAVAFADQAVQRRFGGAYVLAPQMSAAHGAEDDIIDGVITLIKELTAADQAIDPERIYLVGASAGGTRTWRMLAAEPDLFAAAIPICGTTDNQAVNVLTDQDYQKLAGKPIWIFHSENDGTIPVANSRMAYQKLGGPDSQVRYTEFTKVEWNNVVYDGHQCWVYPLNDYRDENYGSSTFEWLFAQKTADDREDDDKDNDKDKDKDKDKKEELVSGIKLTETARTLKVKAAYQIKAAVTPAAASDKTLVYRSDKPSVATVSKTGKVVAVKAGTAYITVASKQVPTVTAKLKITVKAPKIKLNAKTLPLKVKQKTTAVKIASSDVKGEKIVSAVSSKKKVVSVKVKKGRLTLKGLKTGKAKVTVRTTNGGKAVLTVKVQKKAVKATRLTISQKKLTLRKGKSKKLKAAIKPLTAVGKAKWTSSNKKVVTVNSKGVVKGVKKGTARITVRLDGKKATCTVRVK